MNTVSDTTFFIKQPLGGWRWAAEPSGMFVIHECQIGHSLYLPVMFFINTSWPCSSRSCALDTAHLSTLSSILHRKKSNLRHGMH